LTKSVSEPDLSLQKRIRFYFFGLRAVEDEDEDDGRTRARRTSGEAARILSSSQLLPQGVAIT
jgi:hypothetical protein